MAGFKTQIKAKFKAKFPKVNLSNKKLDTIVDKLDAKTDSEDTIEEALDAINDITPFEEMAREEDRVRKLESNQNKNQDSDKSETKKEEDQPDPANEPPSWFKSWSQQQEQRLAAIEGEKTATTRKQQLTEKLKDAPETYKNTVLKAFGRMKFDTDEEFSSYLEEVETDTTAVIQEQSNSGLGKDKPGASFGKQGDEKEVSSDMKQYLADMEAAKPKTA